MTFLAPGHAEALLTIVQSAGSPDTVIMRQVPMAPGWFATMTGIAQALLTLTFLVLTAVLVPAAWNFRKSYKGVNRLLEKVYGDVAPIVRHAHTIADNLDYVTTAVRVDVQQLNQTITSANQRLLRAVKVAERRVRELEALVDVVQHEAESVFISTASTVRGVRAGVRTLREELDGEGVIDGDDGEDLVEDTLDEEADDLAVEMADTDDAGPGDDDETGELTDGDDDGSADADAWERPRVRPRTRQRS
jgi:uncharacterized protein YoxC